MGAKAKSKGLRIGPNPSYDRTAKRIRLGGLDADLRAILEDAA